MALCKNCVVGLLGVCSEEFCRPEREGLIEEAQRSAEQHGHTLTEFIKVEDYPIWQARCVRCGQLAVIRLDPLPNEPDIYGEALAVNCPELGDESHYPDGREEIDRELVEDAEDSWIKRLREMRHDEAD
jgi:hypothetical protein